jgi:hypothetical protein
LKIIPGNYCDFAAKLDIIINPWMITLWVKERIIIPGN